MDVESDIPSVPPPIKPRSSRRPKPPATPISPQRPSPSQTRFKRVSPKASPTPRNGFPSPKSITRSPRARAGSAPKTPLVPVTERRSQEDKTPYGKEADVVPDGSSAGREGRQFTVANVGNNGRIYLRPTVRPANQRSPQPNFQFPITPPGTAGFETNSQKPAPRAPAGDVSDLRTSIWTTLPSASPTSPAARFFPDLLSPTSRAQPHRRAISDSTNQESGAGQDVDPGDLKIVISKPKGAERPQTTQEADLIGPSLLDINIPTWRLGTPLFSSGGSPVLRGSSYSPTEEVRSHTPSVADASPRDNEQAFFLPSRVASSIGVPQIRFSRSGQDTPLGFPSPSLLRPMRLTYLSAHLVIEPSMFDDLTFEPASVDKAIARISPHTGAVTAATPARLVAEITSPSFLDYELVSDFFLTYRAFLEPSDLVRMLIARLRWALDREDQTGTVTRVRTFVAARHWILNYFMDDFVVDYKLRVLFCDLLNSFVQERLGDIRAKKPQVKVLAELKKCWRRVCAQFWDGPDFEDSLGAHVAITPGGIAGHRDPTLDPSFWQRQQSGAPQLGDSLFTTPKYDAEPTSFYADVSRAGHVGDSTGAERPRTPENQIIEEGDAVSPPVSMNSVDYVSCSFPGKTMRALNPQPGHPMAAHPISPTAMNNNQGSPLAPLPKAFGGGRNRPSHKRGDSLTDSLRERGSDKVEIKDQEFLVSVPFAGSLVRGNLLPPTQAFVDIASPKNTKNAQRQTTLFQPQKTVSTQQDPMPVSVVSGQGMRRLLGNVRRAFGSKGLPFPPLPGVLGFHTPSQDSTTRDVAPATPIETQASRKSVARPPVRIDLLGAEVTEAFQKAVREEEAAVEAERQGRLASAQQSGNPITYSPPQFAPDDDSPEARFWRAFSDTGITTRSKSIIIIDDTAPRDIARQTQPFDSPLGEQGAYGEPIVPHGADPTPPTTPPIPGEQDDVYRGFQPITRRIPAPGSPGDNLPPFIPDLDTLGLGSPSPQFSEQSHYFAPIGFKPSPASLASGQTFGLIQKHRSRRQHSLASTAHRRHTSFDSTALPSLPAKSYRASTAYSEGSVIDDEASPALPAPLRVLRRRPGGDLRAATNVGQLDHLEPRRSRSVESLSTFSESFRSSLFHSANRDSYGIPDIATSDDSQGRLEALSLSNLTEKTPRRGPSLFSGQSADQGYEAETPKFDNEDDDGGVESALLKLEGKYPERQTKTSGDFPDLGIIQNLNGDLSVISRRDDDEAVAEDFERNLFYAASPASPAETISYKGSARSDNKAEESRAPKHRQLGSFLTEGSGDSYSSIPILERGHPGYPQNSSTDDWTDQSVRQNSDAAPASDFEASLANLEHHDSSHLSLDFVEKHESSIKASEEAQRKSREKSFLDDASVHDSDISSELSDEAYQGEPSPTNETAPRANLPPHPLGAHPMTPPTPAQGLFLSPTVFTPPQKNQRTPDVWPQGIGEAPPGESMDAVASQVPKRKPLPASPRAIPSPMPMGMGTPQLDHRKPSTNLVNISEALAQGTPNPDVDHAQKYSVHLPFILAFESETLAQQFTLIEKDALNEIDWKELIDMQWKNCTNNHARSWVDFLRHRDPQGVEVVIARFNIMVKWAISEIVLTQHIEERARCIIKLIHIASHCRKFRNFATLAQITIALSSNEVARLSKTWSMVPPEDLQTLHALEKLVTPKRNFYDLRAEMEMGSDSGCIPFVGIYTHDLLFNAQRPSEIASSPTTAPLVNFERCRIGAAVVKTLLRLLEASMRYDFVPVEGITERCLWIGALSDEEIRRYSEGLQ